VSSFLEKEYKLKGFPFDSKVDLFAPMAGRAKEKKTWEKIVNQRVGQRGNSFNFIVGDYGMGKSFSLFKIFEDIKTTNQKVMPVFLTLLPEDSVRKFGLVFVQRIFSQFELKEIRQILSPLKKKELDFLIQLLPEPGKIFLLIKQGNELAYIFLRGDRNLTAKEMKELGITRKLDSTDRAKEYLLSFLYLMKAAGLDTLLLAVDEVEYIFSQMKGAKIALAINTLRGIYDLQQSNYKAVEMGNVANMIFFFGISEDGWRRLNELQKRERSQGGPIQPFMDRKGDVITLEPLNQKETKSLIELRLKYDRLKGALKDKPLIPFTDDFVAYVYKLTKGRPRTIVDRCDKVLREGLEQKIKLLTVNFASKVYESYGLPTDV
jgi:hypothetical protein